MRWILVFLLGATMSHAHSYCNIERELERERREDLEAHECRACREIEVWADGNCPAMGYECDEKLAITTRVLSPNDCNCAQLRCRDTHAFIAVNGTIAGKLRCMGRKWMAPHQEAESAVCARSCGTNVCPQQSGRYFLDNPSHFPLNVSAPDKDHPCAWAQCETGALAKPVDGSSDVTFKGLALFACTGDRSWTYTGSGAQVPNLKVVVCLSNECQRLPFAGANHDCQSKYLCYAPKFEDGDVEDWKKMACDVPNALRSESDNTEIAPKCKAGVWEASGNAINSSTKVMCITCPNIKKNPDDEVKPTVSENNKEAKCPEGQLTIEFGAGKTTPVSSLKCSSDFAWTASGGNFLPYDSLEDLVNQGIEWRARCIKQTSGDCKSCTKELVTITTSGQGAHNFDDVVIDSSGDCAILKFTCKGANANIEINHRGGVIFDGDDGSFDNVASLAVVCNSDGTGWKRNEEIVTQVECASTGGSACQALHYDGSNAACTSKKYDCYEPEFKNGEVPAKMDCKDPGALRLSADNTKIAPTCKNAVWTENGAAFDQTKKVMCINCPTVTTNSDDGVQPVSDRNRAVTCPNGQLTIEYERDGIHQIPVSALTCSPGFAWSATDGPFPGFPSFPDLNNEIKWRARCLTTPNKCKSCSRDLITITAIGAGALPFDSYRIDEDGPCAIRTFICKGALPNIEINRGEGTINDIDDGLDGVAKLAVMCNPDGTAWTHLGRTVTQVECASTGGLPCQALPYDPSNVVCTSNKYQCYQPEFKKDEVPAKMDCKDPGALRLSEDNTKIAPTCKNAVWTENGEAFDKTKKVMCINCPDIDMDKDDEVKPTVSGNNKEVKCPQGQLTIEYGDEVKTSVSSLKCSPDFAWTATGGNFHPYSSLEHLVSQGIAWKARCLIPTSGDCQSCAKELISITKDGAGAHDFASDNIDPRGNCAVRTFTCEGASANIEFNHRQGVVTDDDDGNVDGVASLILECNKEGTAWLTRDSNKRAITHVECASSGGLPCQSLIYDASHEVCKSKKYQCYEPEFKNGEVPAKMDCKDPGALRLSEDNSKIAPTCKNGGWTENGADFDKTKKVMCINCPDVTTVSADAQKPVFERNRAATCPKGQLNIEYDSDGPHQTEVATLTCSPEFAWTASGKFPPFTSFDALVAKGAQWKARCLSASSADCQSCSRALITISTSGHGAHDFFSDIIDPRGTCAKRTLTCKGVNTFIELNNQDGVVQDGEDGEEDDIATLVVECNAEGTAWTYKSKAITRVECSSGV